MNNLFIILIIYTMMISIFFVTLIRNLNVELLHYNTFLVSHRFIFVPVYALKSLYGLSNGLGNLFYSLSASSVNNCDCMSIHLNCIVSYTYIQQSSIVLYHIHIYNRVQLCYERNSAGPTPFSYTVPLTRQGQDS